MADRLAAHPPGTRVAVRHRLRSRDERTGSTVTETVGILVAVTDTTFALLTRSGETVHIDRSAVLAARVVPPAPSRRGAPHRALSPEDVQRLMVDAWPPMEREALGDWVLRAARGFTGRGNSALAVGEPGLPLAEAVDTVEAWYGARGLPANLVLVTETGFDPWASDLGAELRRRGYTDRVPTRTLTAAAREVVLAAGGPEGSAEVELAGALTEPWFAAYRRYRPVDDEAARAILTGSPDQVFGLVRRGEEVVAIGRLGVAHAWGGIAAMWVDPAVRRSGLGRAMVGALAGAAVARGLRSLHLQTDSDNAAALALYESVGFATHHGYVNVVR